jgi:hypothetical protein
MSNTTTNGTSNKKNDSSTETKNNGKRVGQMLDLATSTLQAVKSILTAAKTWLRVSGKNR